MAPDTTRYVDSLPSISPRPVEMQVLCLGLSRTSTMSLYTALGKLGYKSYHMLEVFSTEGKKNKHVFCWYEALMARMYGTGKLYGREEFDKVLGNYSAVTDAPNVNFVDALLAAYPEAKVVLSIRDPDKWLASMESSYYRILGWKSWRVLVAFHEVLGTYTSLLQLILTDWTSGDWQNRQKLREGFLKHNEHVRSVVPKDNLLVFRVEEGWEPLCKFLGKSVPDEPYPKVNEGSNAANIHHTVFWITFAKLLGKAMVLPAAVGALAWGLRWYQRGGRFHVLDRLW